MATQWRSHWCIEVKPTPAVMVIFGAAGDLAKRKLYPALAELHHAGLWPDGSGVIGVARRDYSDGDYRRLIVESLPPELRDDDFQKHCSFLAGDYRDEATYAALKAAIAQLTAAADPEWPLNVTFYLATAPEVYADLVPGLGKAGLLREEPGMGWRHVVFEKPFGRDLESARKLDAMLAAHLREDQIYRIDHYLGKDTVQNILIARFANVIFEPVWNNRYIDHVEITVAETLGVEHRANYYEKAGLVRDMFQNHLLQMLMLIAMNRPAAFNSDAMLAEQLRLLKAVRPFDLNDLDGRIRRGQYRGYRSEPDVAPDSRVETYAAATFYIDNERWRGVPFYLRSGKRLARRVTEVAITFKRVVRSIFGAITPDHLAPDTLVLEIQPDEGMALTIQAKEPGPKLCMGSLTLDFNYRQATGEAGLDAYSRLLLDAMLGDQTLFIRSAVIEEGWKLFTPVLEYWEAHPETAPELYDAGTGGPSGGDRLLQANGHEWRPL